MVIDHIGACGFRVLAGTRHVMLMDFDPGIAGIASQPFWLHWQDEDGRSRRHAPDFFARRADGGGLVVDVRPDERIPPEDAEVFRMTAMACGQAGWEFRRAGTIDPVVRANVRWLSRYRHPRCRREPTATELLEAFTAGRPLLAGAAQVGDPVAVLPVAYHLLWLRELSCDLSVLLDGTSMTWRAAMGSI
ncbi:MAG TPA: TnsA-like heteromeric transposase endonuclease subunit [Streptosporangiaceae bacterium]